MLPWAFAQAQVVLASLAIGKIYRENESDDPWNKYAILFAALAVAIVFAFSFTDNWTEGISMKRLKLNTFAAFLLIPTCMTYVALMVSRLMEKTKVINTVFASIGRASLTIFFTHTMFLHLFVGMPNAARITFAVISGLALHYIFSTNRYTSLLFLGKKMKS